MIFLIAKKIAAIVERNIIKIFQPFKLIDTLSKTFYDKRRHDRYSCSFKEFLVTCSFLTLIFYLNCMMKIIIIIRLDLHH